MTRLVDQMTGGWIDLPARLLVSLLFLVSAWTKLAETSVLQGYMHALGVPVALVWPAAAWELGAGVLFLVGGIRPVSVLLAGWCILTAVIFHTAVGELDALTNFFKNCTIAGAFLLIARTHPSVFSVDVYLARRTAR